MTRYKGFEIQQDCANARRVIETGRDGTRRAIDNPPCKTIAEARRFINYYIEYVQQDND